MANVKQGKVGPKGGGAIRRRKVVEVRENEGRRRRCERK